MDGSLRLLLSEKSGMSLDDGGAWFDWFPEVAPAWIFQQFRLT